MQAAQHLSAAVRPEGFEALRKSLPQEDLEVLENLQAAVEAFAADDLDAAKPLMEIRDKLLSAYRDKAALLKRDWTDEMFQEGEGVNEERVAEIEASLARGLTGGLEDGVTLGGALDIVGVYLKNYKLDKADAVLARCGPHISNRGGVWMVKWLNHISTVRMKQSRYVEALEMLYDLELYSPYTPEEAPEFFEILFRNLAWALKALGRIDDALVYFERMATASASHKGTLDWFDFWDIGKLAAAHGYRDGAMAQFYRGRAMVGEALRMQVVAEPDDLVMRAKVHDSLAECFMVVKDYDDATHHYSEAYRLMLETVGPNSPLFGKQARHSANLHLAQGQQVEALPFLGQALAVEASRDAVNLPDALEIVDLLVNTQQRCPPEYDLGGLPSNHSSLKAMQKNLQARAMADNREYGVLCHKISLLYLHEARSDEGALRRARRSAKESLRLLRKHSIGGEEDSGWLRMAEIQYQMLSSPRIGEARGGGR